MGVGGPTRPSPNESRITRVAPSPSRPDARLHAGRHVRRPGAVRVHRLKTRRELARGREEVAAVHDLRAVGRPRRDDEASNRNAESLPIPVMPWSWVRFVRRLPSASTTYTLAMLPRCSNTVSNTIRRAVRRPVGVGPGRLPQGVIWRRPVPSMLIVNSAEVSPATAPSRRFFNTFPPRDLGEHELAAVRREARRRPCQFGAAEAAP